VYNYIYTIALSYVALEVFIMHSVHVVPISS